MSIIEILSTDAITDSREDINSNFSELDTLKAPIANPTFTGTVGGVTAEMVGLGTTSTPRFARVGLGRAADNNALVAGTLDATVNKGFYVNGDTVGRFLFGSYVTGDAQLRFTPQVDGTMNWGNGTDATDTNLYRSAANTLKTDDNLIVAGAGTAANSVATIDATQTLTNKRITPRITSITSHATPTINTDNCDAVTITAQAEAITSMTTNLSGTPTNFQKLIFRIKDNGTARAITWGASFEAKGVALPTTTVISKVLTVGFIYDSVTSKWGCVASAQEA